MKKYIYSLVFVVVSFFSAGSVFATGNHIPPTVMLNATPMYVSYGGSATLIWDINYYAASCTASGGANGWAGSKNTNGGTFQTGPLTSTTTFSITCQNNYGSDSDSVTITVASQPAQNPIVNLSASQTSLSYGGTTTLSWSTSNATNCTAVGGANGWAGSKSTSGGSFSTGALTSTTTYSITCTNNSGSATDTLTISVGNQPAQSPTVNLSASQTYLNYNEGTTLNWSASNATSCTASGGTNGWSGSKNVSGGSFYTGALTSSTTYSITCTNSSGSASDSLTITVAGQQNPPSVDLYASQTNVNYGDGTTLNWVTTGNATSCTASGGTNGWSGSKSISGGNFYTGALTSTTTYTISCSNQGGNASDSVTVSVQNQNVTPTVSTNSATGVGYNYALLNGFVSANGGNSVSAWFEWGTNSGSLYNQTNQVNYGSASGTSYSYSLGGLSQNTTYYFRAVAQSNNGQTVYGNVMSFTTQNSNTGCTYNCGYQNQPNVTTYTATNISDNYATLNGYINTNGSYASTWFEWGTNSSNLFNSTPRMNQGSSSGNFNQQISGLSSNNTYYFRAVAEGSNGKVYGNVLYFSTSGYSNTNTCGFGRVCEPTAVTTIATNIGQGSARLNGLALLNGDNTSTNGYFEWGTTQNMGNRTTENYVGNSTTNPFYASLFNLAPGTTYYFRAVATNPNGTARGDIVTFRTNNLVVVDNSSTSTSTTRTNIVYRDTTLVTNTNNTTGVSKPSLVFLSVSNNGVFINRGNTIEYFVNYKNVSSENLRDVVLRVALPKELQFTSTSAGYFSEENSTVVVNLGDLFPAQEGSVRITVQVLDTASIDKVIVVTANLAYTITRNGNQEEVFAYAKNNIGSQVVLGGAALFGSGFFPTTLVGWLLLLLILLLILLAIRMAYTSGRDKTPQYMMPVAARRPTPSEQRVDDRFTGHS